MKKGTRVTLANNKSLVCGNVLRTQKLHGKQYCLVDFDDYLYYSHPMNADVLCADIICPTRDNIKDTKYWVPANELDILVYP